MYGLKALRWEMVGGWRLMKCVCVNLVFHVKPDYYTLE